MRSGSWLGLWMWLMVIAGFAMGCTGEDNPETQTDTDPIAEAELALLPADARFLMLVDLDVLLAGSDAALVRAALEGRGVEPALNDKLKRVQSLLIAMKAESVDHALLLQTTDPSQGFLLIARLKRADALDMSALTAAGTHQGKSLYENKASGLTLAQPTSDQVIVGPLSLVKKLLDVAAGAAPRAADAPIGPYLSALDRRGALRFVLGLPALYDGAAKSKDSLSLTGARSVGGAFDVAGGKLSGSISVYSDNAEAFVSKYQEIMGESGSEVRFEAAGRSPSVAIDLKDVVLTDKAEAHVASRSLLKRLFHGMNAADYARNVGAGGNAPWMNFQVAPSPNSIFINFRFRDEQQVQAFEAEHLPRGFKMVPMSLLQGEPPGYFLVVNAYSSGGGLVSGARVEWSVFVRDPVSGEPRFLVVQAAAEVASADSVNLLTPPEPVKHQLAGNAISTYVGKTEGSEEKPYFRSQITWPPANGKTVRTAREFVAANDYIYWGNGVSDRGLYSGSVHNRDAVRVDPAEIVIEDLTPWAAYIEPTPLHAFIYTVGLDIVVSPWFNLDADYLDVTAEHRKKLADFKNNFYPATIRTIAEKALRGEGAAVLTEWQLDNAVPSASLQFEITDPEAFASAIALPAPHKLAQVHVFEDDSAAAYYLTLNIFHTDGAEGRRAEWLTYTDDGSGHVHRMIVEAASSDVRVEPISMLALPAVVQHSVSGEMLESRIQSSSTEVQATLNLAGATDVRLSLDWIEAYDVTCERDGICDKSFYDGAMLVAPVSRLDPEAISLEVKTPWATSIKQAPTSVFVRRNAQVFAGNPFYNVP